MNVYVKSNFFRQAVLAFTGMPLLIWALGNFPGRSLLSESLSVMTMLAFWQMIGQFFWARTNRYAVKDLNRILPGRFRSTGCGCREGGFRILYGG